MKTALLYCLTVLATGLLSRRHVVAQTFLPPRGLIPADSQAVESIYAQHKKAQAEVVARLGAAPDLRKLVCASTSLAGFVSKNSSIHLTPTLKTRSALASFKAVGVPIYDTCQVWVSDTWRFIYLRQPKSSSSAVIGSIKTQICKGHCRRVDLYPETDMTALARIWDSYFVFTVVRNPWTRALSAYTMFSRGVLRKVGDPGVPQTERCGMGFQEYTEDAYRLRSICDTHQCCAYVGTISAFKPGFVDAHISDHSHCMFLPGGEPLVDYIGASEAFDDAWTDIVAEINRRTGSAIKARKPKKLNSKASGGLVAGGCGGEHALEFYNATTATNVARQFALDVVRLGFA
eukprot:jgi/Ulvmu1/12802/UM097_0031.1